MGWMGRNADLEDHRQVLMRMLAMLMSFAGMARRLPGLHPSVRHDLLIQLCRAEASTQAFIFAEIDLRSVVLLPHAYLALSISLSADTADDERLALSFRALALVLSTMLAQTEQSDPPVGAIRDDAFRRIEAETPRRHRIALRRQAVWARDGPAAPWI